MSGQKVVDSGHAGLKETVDRLAKANGIGWYGHVLRMDDNSVVRVALDLEVSGKRSDIDQSRPGRNKWRRKQRRLVYRRMVP